MRRFVQSVRRLAGDGRGQDLIEYALLGSLIAIVVALQVQCLGMTIDQRYDGFATGVESIPPP